MKTTLQNIPKVELHLHLDCSVSYRVASKLIPSLSLKDYERDFVGPPKCEDLNDYLKKTVRPLEIMQSETSLREVVFDLFHQLKLDNIIYVEIRFAPLLHLEGGLTPEAAVHAVESATQEAADKFEIEARLILCTLRHFTQAQSLATAKLAKKFQGTLVAAIDLAADEAGFPITAHIDAFRYAAEQNIHRTAHAGESLGPTSIWETLQYFNPSRIGHGIRAIEDEKLIEYLRNRQIHLEICPTSNIQTTPIKSIADHPIDKLYRSGISLSISTDSRAISNVSLTKEYENIHKTFGWTEEDFLKCNLNALRAAFIPDSLKSRLEEKLRKIYLY